MKLSKLLLTIASVVVGVWLLSIVFKLAAWLISGLLYVAAIIFIVWLIALFIEQRKNRPKA